MKRLLHLNNPKTFNEKIQWLKIYDRNPEYTIKVDKVLVKKYVANLLGNDIIIPTLGVWDSFDDIDFDKLPNQFVLKTNHSGGSLGVVICKDKKSFDTKRARRLLNKSLKSDLYSITKEWPYKHVNRKIFAEQYMEDQTGELKDYKLFCFNGKVKCSFVVSDRMSESEVKLDFYDRNWIKLPFERHYSSTDINIPCPYSYKKMIEYAEILSKGIKLVRIDFYEIDKQLFFGEITFYPGSGFEEFTPEEWDYKLGAWINL
ncbi:MAG: hypothetical protein LBM05_02505 [Endomicrobium sp.]|nr:hypothetical protein [Endomicrobium sp.]